MKQCDKGHKWIESPIDKESHLDRPDWHIRSVYCGECGAKGRWNAETGNVLWIGPES